MATIEFKDAIGRVYFDGGLTQDGKIIRKSKSYRGISKNAGADNLYNALKELAQLSAQTFIGTEKVETSSIIN
ncbi:DUF1659 domain-containing protein [Sporosarcina limicola]|uniref:DUF1659 domain-containing protein n=1 Tax=Sporosarcina limicola TaxID=34101 RepID=A0A927MHB5_9BACL|nr:DUF1659 domain-containing protein [Sporosarcina limicola]MBE1553873.1 hypothetical protein [Sporosarcina limicola]